MKRLALAALLAAVLGPIVDDRAPAFDSYLSPQSTVSSYWHRMIEKRHSEALDCFVGSSKDTAGMFALPELVELRCRDFVISWRSRGIVDVSYDIEYRTAMGESLQSFGTGDRLRLTSQGWKIAQPLMLASRGQ